MWYTGACTTAMHNQSSCYDSRKMYVYAALLNRLFNQGLQTVVDGSDGLLFCKAIHGDALLLLQAVGIKIQRYPRGAVPQQYADRFHIHTQFHQAGCEGVTQRMKVHVFHAQFFCKAGQPALKRARLSGPGAAKNPRRSVSGFRQLF